MHHRSSLRILFAICLAACGDDAPAPDAGSADAASDTADSGESDAGESDSATLDAGPNPAEAAWTVREAPADGPRLVWGSLTAEIDSNTAIMFGGVSGRSTLDRVFLFESGAGETTVREIESTGPAARYCGCAAYDSARNVVVVAGGRNVSAPLSLVPDTWELDLETEVWSEVEAPMTPGGLGCHLAYASGRGAMYMFGGAHMDGPSDKMYRYDPTAPAWIEVAADSARPSARYDGHFERLDDDTLLLFGGSFGARGAAFFSDVWRFDATTETFEEIIVAGDVPPGRRVPWARLTSDRAGLYVAMGFDGEMLPIGDFWYLDLESATWTEVAIPVELTPRAFTSWLPGEDGSVGLMLSGFDGVGEVGEAWQLQVP